MKRVIGAVLAGVGLLLAGCSPAVTGGETTCKNFMKADQKTQDEAVSKMLKDEKGSEPVQLMVTGTRIAVQGFCQTAGKADSQIKQAPHL
jgi:acid stress chaperone HdeA